MAIPFDKLRSTNLDKVLGMHQVDKKGQIKRNHKRAKITNLWSNLPPLFDLWMDADKVGIKGLKQMEIEIKDAILGRYHTLEKQWVHVAVTNLNYSKRGAPSKHLVKLEEKRLVVKLDSGEGTQEDVD